MPNASPDRRQHSRVAFSAPAEMIFANRTSAASVVDLSLKGALVALHEDVALDVGAACVLRVDLDALDAKIQMNCRLAHVLDGKAGLSCLDIDLDSVTHLRRLVELNLGDPQLLERELSALIVS